MMRESFHDILVTGDESDLDYLVMLRYVTLLNYSVLC